MRFFRFHSFRDGMSPALSMIATMSPFLGRCQTASPFPSKHSPISGFIVSWIGWIGHSYHSYHSHHSWNMFVETCRNRLKHLEITHTTPSRNLETKLRYISAQPRYPNIRHRRRNKRESVSYQPHESWEKLGKVGNLPVFCPGDMFFPWVPSGAVLWFLRLFTYISSIDPKSSDSLMLKTCEHHIAKSPLLLDSTG